MLRGLITAQHVSDTYCPPAAVKVKDGVIAGIAVLSGTASQANLTAAAALKFGLKTILDYGDLIISPGLIDTHVHFNEPGREHWEGDFLRSILLIHLPNSTTGLRSTSFQQDLRVLWIPSPPKRACCSCTGKAHAPDRALDQQTINARGKSVLLHRSPLSIPWSVRCPSDPFYKEFLVPRLCDGDQGSCCRGHHHGCGDAPERIACYRDA